MRRPMIHSMRSLQIAATATALLFAQAPAFAQGPPAPAPTSPPPTPAPTSPAPAPAPAPVTSPAPAPAPTSPPPAPTASPAPPPAPGAAPIEPWNPTPDPSLQQPPTEPPPPVEPAPPPEPEVAAPPPAPVGPPPPPMAPVDTAKAKQMRAGGVGTMIAGGAISLVGFAMTLAYTVRGNRFEKDLVGAEDAYQIADCSRVESSECDGLTANRDEIRDGILNSDRMTAVSGGILAGGILVTAIGGIVYRVGVKRLTNADVARVRVTPTVGFLSGGISLSGRF